MHVDLDAFFAAVEVLDDPTLAGKPVIVGGSGNRGVVAACTYEARAFGIHSAMSSVEARRRCPHAIFLSGRFSRYAEMSVQFHEVLHGFTPVVEGIGLDEAFLDVAGARRILGSAPHHRPGHPAGGPGHPAPQLRRGRGPHQAPGQAGLPGGQADGGLVRDRGRAPGWWSSPPDGELAFLHPLPVRALWGVGPATGKRLADLGVETVGDLAAIPEDTLCRVVGVAHGRHLAALARGDDARPVVPVQEVKSVGHEETFAADLHDHEASHGHVVRMSDAVGDPSAGGAACGGGRSRSRSASATTPPSPGPTPWPAPSTRPGPSGPWPVPFSTGSTSRPGIRLLGVSVSGLVRTGSDAHQLSFADAGPGGDASNGGAAVIRRPACVDRPPATDGGAGVAPPRRRPGPGMGGGGGGRHRHPHPLWPRLGGTGHLDRSLRSEREAPRRHPVGSERPSGTRLRP